MQLSILPVKEYNVSKDSKEKEKVSASFLSYLQDTQKNSEKKKDAELTNVAIPSPPSTTVPLKTDQNAAGTLVDSTEKKVGLQSLVKNQAAMNGLQTVLDSSQNVGQPFPVMDPIEAVIEKKQGSSVSLEKSFDLHVQGQVIKPIVNADHMTQPVFQQLSQTITTDSMASKKMDMNVIDSGKINSLRSNENSIGKVPSDINKVNVDSLLHKQISAKNSVVTSLPVFTETIESKAVSNRAEKAYSVQSPVQNQDGMKELNKAIDAQPNVLEQSPVMISKGKAIENQLGTSLPIGLNSQISAGKPNAGEIMQQAASTDFEKESQTVTTDSMPNQAIRINKQENGIVNSLISSEGSTSKAQAEPTMVNSESGIHKQISPNNVVTTSSLVKGTMESKVVSNRTKKAYSVQSPEQSQVEMKELNKALDTLPNVKEQSSVITLKGKAIENQLGSSMPIGLNLQNIAGKSNADEMTQQAANTTFQQESQKVTMDSMPNQAIRINKQESGIVNSLVSSEGSTNKIQAELKMVNSESVLHKQISPRESVVTTSLLVKGTMESKVVSNHDEKANSMQLPAQNQVGMKELNKALEALPNVKEQSSVIIPKGKVIENQLGSSIPKGLNLQNIAEKSNADEMTQQAANTTFQQENQKVTMDSMPNQAIRINKQENGIVNSLISSEGSTSKAQAEPTMVNSESALQKQISSNEIAVSSSPLSMRTLLPKTEQKFRDTTDVNHEKPTVEITQSPAERVNPINQLNVLVQNSQNATKSKENNDMRNNPSPNQDQVGFSNQIVSNGITIPNVQATKSFDFSVTPSIPSTVSVFAHDIVSTFTPRIHVTETPEKMEATLSLKPKHLGAVDVKVVIQNGHMSARLIADSSVGRATLEQNVDTLYVALQQQGFQVDKINITQHNSASLSSAFSQGGDSAPKQGQQQSKRRGDSYIEKEEYSDSLYELEWVSQINTMA